MTSRRLGWASLTDSGIQRMQLPSTMASATLAAQEIRVVQINNQREIYEAEFTYWPRIRRRADDGGTPCGCRTPSNRDVAQCDGSN